ncbi:peptide ABC transporter ATP-binding protein [Haladaptatus sp. W1]|uniref:ABC transporter ATP-binding protein n=1 Tax=Haladaptatus sp. W1 TaxID=1897478 RepID=UPI0008498012|nr:oligopeptide/dipeptide ABC transporter ATP-binding protein [Haladaptatus sp. W1]ODR82907.1 peptide ABC transporter ATP-binding protein [Haladaptatus sp. W1]
MRQENATEHEPNASEESLLTVRGLKKHYAITSGVLSRETGRVRAVDGIDFELRRGETLGLVGESGCGKSTVARTVVSLEAPTEGRIRFRERSVASLSKRETKRYRRQVQMVFQNPASSFDPRMTIGESIAEPMVTHGLTDDERLEERITTLLELVGLAEAKRERYPHELSGGEKQRAALARALSLNPDLLVLDEPVSALDVSVQAEILALIERLQDAFDLSILLISHDMSVVHQLCDRVVVMYLGEAVEVGRTESLFADPKHPYTKALLDTVPRPDPHHRNEMVELTGDVPDPASPPSGCRFHTRCPKVVPPEGWSLTQSAWNAVFSLRVALRDSDFGLTSVRERVADGSGDDGTETVSETDLRSEIRREYGIPSTLDQRSAEEMVSNAIGAAIDGNVDAAAELLGERFSTVCETEHPKRRSVDGRDVGCHLYEEDEDETNSEADGEC